MRLPVRRTQLRVPTALDPSRRHAGTARTRLLIQYVGHAAASPSPAGDAGGGLPHGVRQLRACAPHCMPLAQPSAATVPATSMSSTRATRRPWRHPPHQPAVSAGCCVTTPVLPADAACMPPSSMAAAGASMTPRRRRASMTRRRRRATTTAACQHDRSQWRRLCQMSLMSAGISPVCDVRWHLTHQGIGASTRLFSHRAPTAC